MKVFQITEIQGWTVETFIQQEKHIWKYKRIASICMIMEGYMGLEGASRLRLNRKCVSELQKVV